MGIKAVTNWLNERSYRTRVGARWGIGPLHKILTSTTYKGEYCFNRAVWKTKEAKPEDQQITVSVDPMIDPSTFDAVQALLKSRIPKSVPPRVVTGPILLSGLATCASCGGGMTLRTGKIRTLLIHLRDLRAERQSCLQGALDPDGQAGRCRHRVHLDPAPHA